MKKKEKIKKYTKIFETLLFITVVINVLLFAYKKENILSRANYKILVQESEGSSNYVAYNGSKFPKSGYTFASYECENGGTVTQTSKGVFSYTGDSDSCVLKFDISPFSCDDDSLYCVLANEAEDGGLAAKYNGEHADAFDRSGTEDIYYFTTPIKNDETQGNQLLDKWNVIFGGFCWQMLRTTDTGGVKMIYNGVPSNGTCNNTGEGQQIGLSTYNDEGGMLSYVGYMYNTVYERDSYSFTEDSYTFGNSFTYSNGIYTLTDTITVSNDLSKTDLSNHHYTCFNNTGSCSSVNYIVSSVPLVNTGAYYLNLTNGKSIEDAINEMLYADDVNSTNSVVKTVIDAWYQNNLSSYSNYLEDTVFCNDRTIDTYAGWNPNGGNINDLSLYFHNNNAMDLSCTNDTDRFSTLNNKAKLTYPIGLANLPEFVYINNLIPLTTGQTYWLMTPGGLYFPNGSLGMFAIYSSGRPHTMITENEYGVRPVISLKPGTEYASGDGSKNNPYIVSTSKAQTTLVKLQKLNSNIQVNSGTPDFSQIATTDEGLYSAEDDYGTSYYWRGAATTNYIQFGKNANNEDLYWRIVRINGDGSLRLFYAGTSATATDNIGTSKYNENNDDNAYVGYMYGTSGSSSYESTHENINSSSLKSYLENWYSANLSEKSFEKYISDVIFCNDRVSTNGYSQQNSYYGSSYPRVPSLLCTQVNDKFTKNDVQHGNAKLSYSIGTLTYDEIIFGGANTSNPASSSNSNNFLYKPNEYWTMTSRSFTNYDANVGGSTVHFGPAATVYTLCTNNIGIPGSVNLNKIVVPVINISQEAVKTLTGAGTSADPFVVH